MPAGPFLNSLKSFPTTSLGEETNGAAYSDMKLKIPGQPTKSIFDQAGCEVLRLDGREGGEWKGGGVSARSGGAAKLSSLHLQAKVLTGPSVPARVKESQGPLGGRTALCL